MLSKYLEVKFVHFKFFLHLFVKKGGRITFEENIDLQINNKIKLICNFFHIAGELKREKPNLVNNAGLK